MKNIAEIIDNATVHVYDLTQFDIDAIMHSGQVFRYFPNKNNNGYQLVVGNNIAEIYPDDGKVIIKSNDSDYFFNYFDLRTDYNEIKRDLNKYEKLRPAITVGGGIRILRADFAEMVLSFIISANNNIKRFTKTLNLLCEKYGAPLDNSRFTISIEKYDTTLSCDLFAFPTLDQLSKLTADDFQSLGCGYRAPYLVKAMQQLQALDPYILSQLPNVLLDKELRKIQGVGPKVSGCIMLFCGNFHRLDTAPVDTWIKKALGQLTDSEQRAILENPFAGVAQQYIFYYLQHLHREL